MKFSVKPILDFFRAGGSKVKRLPMDTRPTQPPPMPSVKKPRVSEEQLRQEHPALQDAWDQYQTVLKLVKGDAEIEPPSHWDDFWIQEDFYMSQNPPRKK